MKKRLFALALATVMTAGVFSACSSAEPAAPAGSAAPSAAPAASSAEPSASAAAETAGAEAGTSDYSEHYEFTVFWNYDYQNIFPWGEDSTSKYWAEKFNITMNSTKPDQAGNTQLNLMMSSGDYPEVIVMDRDVNRQKAADLGVFLDLAPLMEVNPTFESLYEPNTLELLKVNGVLYTMPHWARKVPTGGNQLWMYDKRLYEAVGSPPLKTFEDLLAYARAVKAQVPTTEEGLSVIPFGTVDGNMPYKYMADGIYRSFGGPYQGQRALFTARLNGKLDSIWKDEAWKKTLMTMNEMYREGLIVDTQFTENQDQQLEKLTNARIALAYYDHSQADVNNFRKIVSENYPGDSYEIITDPVYPPAEGVTKVYADLKESLGSQAIQITTKAENPQRIFDFFTHKLTKQGSIEMMYGPQGELWDELNENGDPILKRPMAELTSDEQNAVGTWRWSFLNHSDNVDLTKFAVNDLQPEDKRSWVESTQAHVLTPLMFMSDEYAGLSSLIDPQSDQGINYTTIEEEAKVAMPNIIMAPSAEEASRLYDAHVDWMYSNGYQEIIDIYSVRHEELVAMQGGSAFD